MRVSYRHHHQARLKLLHAQEKLEAEQVAKKAAPKTVQRGATMLLGCGMFDDQVKNWLEPCSTNDDDDDFVVGVSCAEDATLCVTATGRLRGFGAGPTLPPRRFTAAKQVACGPRHVVLLAGDGVYTWGADLDLCRPMPAASFVACGDGHFCCILQGRLYTWGDGRVGQLGRAGDAQQPLPVVLDHVIHVACGAHHTLALVHEEDEMILYAFGFGDEGRLGTGDETTCWTPQRVLLPISDRRVVASAAGDRHSLALINDGTVFAWGDNTFGQLGVGVASAPVFFPTTVRGRYSRIACGARHSGATTKDGRICLWGFGEEGQLGGGPDLALKSAPGGETAAPVPRPLRAKKAWLADSLALGVRHTVVLCRNARARVTHAALVDAALGSFDDVVQPVSVVDSPPATPDNDEPLASPTTKDEDQVVPVAAAPVVVSTSPSRALLEERLRESRERRHRDKRDRIDAAAAAADARERAARHVAAVEQHDRAKRRYEDLKRRTAPPQQIDEPVVDHPEPTFAHPAPTAQAETRPYTDVFYRDSQDKDVCYVANSARRATRKKKKSPYLSLATSASAPTLRLPDPRVPRGGARHERTQLLVDASSPVEKSRSSLLSPVRGPRRRRRQPNHDASSGAPKGHDDEPASH